MRRHSTSFVRSRYRTSMDVVLISTFWTHPSKWHQTCFLGLYLIYKTFPVKKKTSKQERRKCPEMPFRPSQLQRDRSVRVCCSHRSHFGFRVALVQVQIYRYWRSVTTFLTSHIQYLRLYNRKWVKTVISTTASWFLSRDIRPTSIFKSRNGLTSIDVRNTCTCMLWTMSSYT